MNINDTQAQLVESFQLLTEWEDKYRLLIDMARDLPEFPEEFKIEENQVHGCQSQVWMVAEYDEGKLKFQAISDAMIVSGLIACILKIYSNRTPEEIINTEPTFAKEIGLDHQLSMTRSNGLWAMLNKIKQLAIEEYAKIN